VVGQLLVEDDVGLLFELLELCSEKQEESSCNKLCHVWSLELSRWCNEEPFGKEEEHLNKIVIGGDVQLPCNQIEDGSDGLEQWGEGWEMAEGWDDKRKYVGEIDSM